MEITVGKKEQNDRQNHHSFVSYVYKNKKRCRFNVCGLKNFKAFAKYLIDELNSEEGINNVKPSVITGNVLIEFDSENISHKGVFERLQTVAKTYIATLPYPIDKTAVSSSLSQNRLTFKLHPATKRPTDQCNGNCKSCSNSCSAEVYKSIYNSVNVNYLLSVAVKTTGSLILQRIAKRFVRQSLYRLIF